MAEDTAHTCTCLSVVDVHTAPDVADSRIVIAGKTGNGTNRAVLRIGYRAGDAEVLYEGIR